MVNISELLIFKQNAGSEVANLPCKQRMLLYLHLSWGGGRAWLLSVEE